MVFTKIALALAVLMAGQTPGDSVFTNLRSGRIPMGIQPDRIAEIRELKLFESPDHGRTWNEVDKITPDKEGGFKYAVPADGEYWYQVVAVNQQGKEEPSDIYKSPPMMKLIVDTKPPELKITSAQRQGDELVVSWAVREDNPDPSKLKLEYRTADSTVWTPIPLVPGPTGTAKTTLNTPATIVVRLQFKDLANNAASVEAQVSGTVAVTNYSTGAAPQVPERGPAPKWSSRLPCPQPRECHPCRRRCNRRCKPSRLRRCMIRLRHLTWCRRNRHRNRPGRRPPLPAPPITVKARRCLPSPRPIHSVRCPRCST